jgi:hypothetical protein
MKQRKNSKTHMQPNLGGRDHAVSTIVVRKNMKHHKLARYEMDCIQAMNRSIEGCDGSLTT